MRVNRSFRSACAVLVSAAGALLLISPVLAEDASQTEYELLFVQDAASGGFDGTKLSLENVGPTIFFTDRPQRITGHMRTDRFVSEWGVGKDSFDEDPPNAALSIYSEDALDTAVVELSKPRLEGRTLTYDVKVLDGKLPPRFGESALFIDILGRRRMFWAGAAMGSAAAQAHAQPQTVTEPTQSYTASPPHASAECTAAQNQLLAATSEDAVKLAEQKVKLICGN